MQHAAGADLLHRAVAWLAAAGLVLGGCRDAATPTPSLADLERTARVFFAGMASADAGENRRAMTAIVPMAEDFDALVPEHGQALWAVWGPESDRLVTAAPERSAEYRDVLPVRGVRTVDLRVDAPLVLARSLDVLPPTMPVRGVVIEVTPGERIASAFLPLRGRWVWIWDLERLAAIVAKSAAGGNALPPLR